VTETYLIQHPLSPSTAKITYNKFDKTPKEGGNFVNLNLNLNFPTISCSFLPATLGLTGFAFSRLGHVSPWEFDFGKVTTTSHHHFAQHQNLEHRYVL
jgi:hypothetical protein